MPMKEQNIQKFNLSQEEIIKNILPEFNVFNSTIEEIKVKNTDKQRAVYKIESQDNTLFCLKKVYYNEKDLLFIYSVVEWLYRNGIRVARFLPSKNGSRFVNYNSMLFILTPWIHGEKCDYDSMDTLINVTKTLAKLHKCSENFTPIHGSNFKTGYDDLYISLGKHLEQLLNCYNKAVITNDTFSSMFLSTFEINLQLAKKAFNLAASINVDNLSRSICHGDYVNKNILIDSNGETCIIDFDKCCIDFSAHDIGYFFRRLLRRENTNWNLDLTQNCLAAYNSIKKLNQDDLAYVLAYILFPQKYWRLSRDYYNNLNKVNKISFCNLMRKINDKAESQFDFMCKISHDLLK